MSEAAVEKKKGGKMPVVIILGLMLGAGGFFGMKMRGGADAKPKKPEVKLGKEKAAELKEFLVNLAGSSTYCRAEISLGMAEGSDPKLVEDHEGPVRDAINMCLKSKTLAQVSTMEGLSKLKRDLASAVNDALQEFLPDKDKPEKSDKKKKSDDKDKKDDKKDDDEKPEHPEWDSDTGPVLKVYFSSFATQ